MGKPNIGDLQVWWVPQVPMKAFYVPVSSPAEAKKILSVLGDYDLFQLKHNVKPDFCNAGGLRVYEKDGGDGKPGWCEWADESCDDIDSWQEEAA